MNDAAAADPLAPYQEALRRIAAELEELGFAIGSPPRSRPADAPPGLDRLTRRESAIASALVAGSDVAEIALEFGISEHTVRNHLKSIRQKLGARSLVELVRTLAPHLAG